MADANKTQQTSLASNSSAPAEMYSSGRMVYGGSMSDSQTTDFRSKREKSSDAFLYTLPNTIIAGLASVAESMPGVSEEGVDAIVQTMTPKGMYQDYKSKEGGYKLAGGLVATVPVIFGVSKLMRAKSLYNKVESIAGTKAAKVLLPNKYSMSDRVKTFREKVEVATKKQQNSFTQETTQEINSAIKKNVSTEFFDMIKIGVATDAAIYATQNNNEFLFPEEMSAVEIAAFYGAPNIIIGAAAGAVVRYQMKEVFRAAGAGLAAARNVGGLPINEATSIPGARGLAATNNFMMSNNKTVELKEVAGDPTAIKNISAQETVYAKNGMEQAVLMAKDSLYPGVTNKYALSEAGYNTINANRKDVPDIISDVVSIESGTEASMQKVLKNYDSKMESLKKKSVVFSKNLAEMHEGDRGRDTLVKNLNTVITELEDLSKLDFVKLQPDGVFASADVSKALFAEKLTGKIRNVESGNLTNKMSKAQVGDLVKIKDKGVEGEVSTAYAVKYALDSAESYVSVGANFELRVPNLPVQTGKDVKRVVDDFEKSNTDIFKQSLHDIGLVYHYKTGQLGKPIYDSLSNKAQNALTKWVGSSQGSILRKEGFEASAVREELTKAYEPVRQAFREIADADGLVPALRGESVSSSTKPRNDIVSMTFSPSVAKGFGRIGNGHVVAVRIHPDDIIAVVGGLKDEFEIIVKGNMRRSLGAPMTSRAYEDLSFTGKTAAQTVLKKFADDWKPGTPVVQVDVNSHHTQLDAIMEVAKKYGVDSEEINQGFKLPKNMDWEQLEMYSLNAKFKEYSNSVEKMGMGSLDLLKLPETSRKNLDDVLIELNLPNNGTGGLTPLMQLFEDLRLQDRADLLGEFPNTAVFKKELEKYAFPRGDLENTYTLREAIQLRGSQFVSFAEKREPLLLVTKTSSHNLMQKADLIEATALQRGEIIDELKNGHELIGATVASVTRDPERFKQAKAVDQLIEGSATHSDRVTQAMFGLSNQPTILAADSIQAEVETLFKSYIAKQFEPHNEMFNRLISDKADLDFFAIARHQDGLGWRGKPDFVPAMEGDKLIGYKIKLENHASNSKMAKEFYDIDFDDFVKTKGDMYLPVPKLKKDAAYAPLVIPPNAAKALMAIDQISQDVRNVINTLRRASGMKELSKKEFHLVPKNIAAKEKRFLINSQTGELHSIASGNTANQAAALASEDIAIAKKRGIDLFIASDKEVESYSLLQLNDPTKMVDYSTSFRQTGQATGKSFGDSIELGPAVLQEMQESLIRQYSLASRVTSSIIFDPEFRAVKVAAETSGLSTSTLTKGNTVFDAYIRRSLGIKSGNEKQTIGKLYGTAEDVYDKLWQKAWDHKISLTKGGQTTAQADTGFKNLNNSMGPEYNPFKDSVEYMESTMRIKAPQNALKHMSSLNAITGASLLRLGEVGLGVINILSLPTLIPVVARALRPAKGQSIDEWRSLNAAWSSEIKDGEALWNPIRASISGTNFFFSKEGQSLMKEAHNKGHLWQKAVEQMQLFTDPTQPYWKRILNKNVDRASVIVDKTEEWSRGISYATFYKLGKESLKMNHDSSMEFAHHMANRVIGDFRPNNRPQIFQGAAGMPFGLFTTFAWNYLQRVFGYVEKGEFNQFFYQMGLQSAFFGAKSLPGFNQYVEHFSSNYDGTENMVDRMQRNLGTSMTDAILFGSVGSLTGLAAYSRTEIGLPGSNFARTQEITSMMPAAGMIQRAYQGISESIESLKANQGFNGRQIAEISSRAFPVSSVKGWIQVGMGQTVDSRGQLINENINTAVERFAKISNIKTLREQLLIEEFSRNRGTEMKWKALRARARKALRASYRAGKLDNDTVNQVAKDFLRSDGNPDDLDNFFTGEIEAALVNKGYLKALLQAKKVSQADQMMRMINILGNKEYE